MENLKKQQDFQIVYGVFNKHNGVLFAFETKKDVAYNYDSKHFVVKEVTLYPGQYYFGDYETGQVHYHEDKPLVREDEIQSKFYKEITQKYPIIEQLISILEVLDNNKDIIKTEKFNEIATFVKTKKIRYDASLKATRKNKDCFNFVSIKDLEEHTKKRVEGLS